MSVEPIADPTWQDDIAHMFNGDEISCMKDQGIDLSKYCKVKENAEKIYKAVAAAKMPPGHPWSDVMVTTFENWLNNKCPEKHESD